MEMTKIEIQVGHITLPVLIFRDRGRSKRMFPPRYKAITFGREFLGDSFSEVIRKIWHVFGLSKRGVDEPTEDELKWEEIGDGTEVRL